MPLPATSPSFDQRRDAAAGRSGRLLRSSGLQRRGCTESHLLLAARGHHHDADAGHDAYTAAHVGASDRGDSQGLPDHVSYEPGRRPERGGGEGGESGC